MPNPLLRWSAIGAFLLPLGFAAQAQQSVGIGTSSPNAKAVLDISGTGKGLLIPRMDSATRAGISAPPDGLMVFQTDGRTGFWYAFGGAWLYIPDKTRSGDNLGNHTATQNLNLGTNQLVGNGGTSGLSVSSAGKVGIGTSSPSATLQVAEGDAAFTAAGGVVDPAAAPSVSGAGRRTLWYADKAAFRAGYVDNTQWDQNSVGTFSTAFGWNSVASGEGAFAAGGSSTAGGAYAVALGKGNATHDGAVAIGAGASATNSDALALGPSAAAGGLASIALGPSKAPGDFGVAIGLQNAAAGRFSAALGKNARANKQGAMVLGDGSAGFSSDSVYSTANNEFSAAFAGGYRFLTNRTPATVSLYISSAGNIGIGTTSPTATLEVSGPASTVKFAGLAGSGTRVVTADAAGNLATTAAASLADNLGNHTATQKLDLSTFKLVGNGGVKGLSISSGGNVTTDGALTAGGAINAGGNIASGGNLMASGDVISSGAVLAGGDFVSNGTIVSSGGIVTGGSIAAAGSLTTTGPITAGGNVSLGANSLVGNGGTTGLTISSAGAVTTAGALTATGILTPSGGVKFPGAYDPDATYVGLAGNSLSFAHTGFSEDFIGYKNNTFYLKGAPGGGDTADPNLVVGGNLATNGTLTVGAGGTAVEAIIRATINRNLPNIGSASTSAQSFSVANAAVGASVLVSPANALTDGLVIQYARVSAAGTVEVKFYNRSNGSIDEAAMDFYITVIQ